MKPIPKELNTPFIICLFMEIIGLSLLVFAMYLIPYLLFSIIYAVPSFIIDIIWWLDINGDGSPLMYMAVIFLPLFLVGLLCLFESKRLTERIEQSILGKDELSLAKQVNIEHSGIGYALLRIVLFTGGISLAIWLAVSFT